MVLTYINSNGEHVSFGAGQEYELMEVSGFSAAEITVLTSAGYMQNGATYRASQLSGRLFTITIDDVKGSYEDLVASRMELAKVLNPLLSGRLYINNGIDQYFADCVIYEGLTPINAQGDTSQEYEIAFYSAYPFIRGSIEHSVKMAGFQGGLTLPYSLPYSLGTQGDIITINYSGSIDAPLLVEFRGPAVHPRITKKQTGEYIAVDETLLEGETLWIDTTPKAVEVYTLDSSENKVAADQKTDPLSTYFNLTRGQNTIEFAANSGTPEVYLHWYDQYVGV